MRPLKSKLTAILFLFVAGLSGCTLDLHLDPTDLPQLGLLPNTPELPDVLNSSKPFRSQFAQMQRIFHTATALNNGKILVIGGASGKGSSPTIFNSVEIYDPETGTWASAAPLPHQLMRHTATLLADGKVFVVGGTDNISSAACLTNTALYDPATDTWTATATMTTGRCFHTATLLGDGRVVVIGGRTQNSGADTTNNYTATVEIYDPTTNSWSAGNSLPAARAYHRAVLLTNSKIFVAGGINSSGGIAITALYNPSGNSWSSGPTLSPYRKLPSATLLGNGLVALVGGENSGTALTNTTLYNPDTNTLSEGAALPAGRYLHSATALGNNLIIAGGSSISANLFQDSLIYNSTANQWQAFANLKGFRSEHAAVIAGKYLVLLGGTTGIYAYSPLHTTAEKLDVSAFLWKNETPMTVSRFIPVASALKNGKVMIAGGVTTSPSFGYPLSTEIFDPVTNQWTAGPDLPGPRARATGTLLNNGKVLVVGGQDNAAILSSTVIYDPDTNSWSTGPSLTYARTAHTATLLPDGRVFVAGGSSDNIFGVSSTALYNPLTNEWTAGPNLSSARIYHTATLLPSGKVFIAGGQVPGPGGDFCQTADVYDPATDSITTITLTEKRSLHEALLLPDGKVLLSGGTGGTNAPTTNEICDPVAGTCTAANGRTMGAYEVAVKLNTGRFLLIGAFGVSSYNPQDDSWTAVAPLLTPRVFHTATLLPSGKVLVTGGVDAATSDFLSSVEIYDPQTDTWTAGPSLPGLTAAATATLLPSGKVAVIGGTPDNFTAVKTVSIYDPETNQWTAAEPLADSRSLHTATLLPNGHLMIFGGINSEYGPLPFWEQVTEP